MPRPVRPNTVVMIGFEGGGSITIQTPLSKEKVRALMKGDKDGEIVFNQVISVTEVHETNNPNSPLMWLLDDEEVTFPRREKILFWSVQVAKEPPLIQEVQNKILTLQ